MNPECLNRAKSPADEEAAVDDSNLQINVGAFEASNCQMSL